MRSIYTAKHLGITELITIAETMVVHALYSLRLHHQAMDSSSSGDLEKLHVEAEALLFAA